MKKILSILLILMSLAATAQSGGIIPGDNNQPEIEVSDNKIRIKGQDWVELPEPDDPELGPELIPDPHFENDGAGWYTVIATDTSATHTVRYSDGVANFISATSDPLMVWEYRNIMEIGKTYDVTITQDNVFGSNSIRTTVFAGGSRDLPTTPGTTTWENVEATKTDLEFVRAGDDVNVEISYVSIKERTPKGGATADRPSSPELYQLYFDTTLGYPVWFDGTNWVDATGTTR